MDNLHTSLDDFYAMGVRCPVCPMCGHPPMLLMPGLHQTWCPNEDCEVFCWVPWDSAAANLADVGKVTMFDDQVE